MIDAVQSDNTNYDKVDGNNVIQQPWNKEDQDPRDESDNRRYMGGCKMHGDLRMVRIKGRAEFCTSAL
jgi:hypothetical protein